MRTWLAALLRCPVCGGAPLSTHRTDVAHTLTTPDGDETVLVSGVLECTGCRRRYPVLDESPRLLPAEQLTPDERRQIERPTAIEPGGAPATQRTEGEIARLVEEAILADYGNPAGGPGLRRARADIDYQKRYPQSRVYQMSWLRRQLESDPRTVLDLGGGRGGNLEAARQAMRFDRGIVVDLSPRWPPLFRRGDRSVAYVRGDAARLPLRDGCADLVISSFLLEHVADWEGVLASVARAAPVAFVSYGPNRAWPWEIGHIGAPLAHCLPRRFGAAAACLWGRLNGDRRGYRRHLEILDSMNYVSSRRYYAACRRAGVHARPVFDDLLVAWAASGSGGIRKAAGRAPALVHFAASVLQALGIEPNVYSILKPDGRSMGS